MPRPCPYEFRLLAVFFTLALQTFSLQAANFVMSGNDAIGVSSFNTGTNWTGGAAPAANNTYQTAAFLLRTPGNSAAAQFAGTSLEIQNGGNLRHKTSALITVTNLILDNGGILDVSANGAGLGGTMSLSGGKAYISVGGSQTFTCNSLISGSGGFYTWNAVSTGVGTTVLTSPNTFSGGIIVNAGTLQANYTDGNGDTPLGSGDVTINAGATLVAAGLDAFGWYPNVAPANFIINGGTVTELGSSSFRITLPNLTFTGGTLTSAAGNNGDASGNYSLFGAGSPTVVTTLSNNTTAVISASKITLQQNNQATGTTTFQVAAGGVTNGPTPGVDLLISSLVANFGGSTSAILKTGAGVLALNTNNTWSGGTTISNGTLQLGTASDTFAVTSPLGSGAVNDYATLSFASSLSATLSNVVSGSGMVAVNAGMAVLAGANTYSGGTTVTNGTLLLGNTSGSATGMGSVTVNPTGILGGGGSASGNVTVNGKTFPGVASTAGITTTLGGNLTYNASAQAAFNLNTSARSSGNDQIILNAANGVLTAGGASVGINLTGAGLDQVNDYTLIYLTGASATIAGGFAGVPVWLGTIPANAASYSVVNVGNKVVLHFTSGGTTNLPGVANVSASSVTVTSARLNGQLVSTGGEYPSVKIYFGTANGGTNPAGWANTISLGLQTGAFGAAVSNLTPNTTYYFTAAASNSAGVAWAVPTFSFATPPLTPASVTNLPASNVQGNSAILNGQVTSIGSGVPNVTLYYGSTDGGTNAGAWANNIFLGPQSGAFAVTVTGLSTNTTYYYAAAAANNSGTGWARPSASFTTLPTAPAISVLTYHNDNYRTGANTNEFLLTPATVNSNNFGLLIKYPVDGFVYAQPLYVPNLAIPGQGTHNVVFVATEHNSIYAFDADNNAGANGGLLWRTNFGTAPLSNNHEFGDRYNNNNYIDITPEVGITGTPVIDPASGTMYVDVLTREVTSVTNYYHRIHALNITTGAEQPYGPVLVTATFPGTGVGGNGTTVTFDARFHGQRPAMTLAGGMLFVSYGSFADTDPYHGWVLGYRASNLQFLTNYVFNTTPNAKTSVFGANAGEGALWMGGNGLCVDANTNLYFETGNGSFSANTNGGDYGDSFVKLSTGNGLAVSDYFTPYNQLSLANADSDLGSGGPILLPDEVGSAAHPHLIVGGGKAGRVFLIDRDNMGHFNSSSDSQIVQWFDAGAGSFFGTPAYFNYRLYYQGVGGVLKAFSISNAVMTTAASSTSPTSFNGKGITASISANGTNNGIAWTIQTDGSSPSDTGSAVLHAYNAANLAQELYNSSQNSARDNPGAGVKYTVPTVVNGKVFVGAQYALSIYGSTAFLATPVISPNGAYFTNSVTVTLADATPGAAIYYTLDGTAPTTNSILYTGPFAVTASLNLQVIAVKSGAANSAVASASFVNSAAVGNGIGLSARYWSNTTSSAFTNISFSAAASLVRTDAVVNFNWGTNGPAVAVGTTNFTARWTGSIQPQYTETYTLRTVADDGVRLWINGQLLINAWSPQSAPATNSATIVLNAQQLYTVQLDYFQGASNASVQLLWSSPSTALGVIPQTQLYPYTNPPPSVVLSSPASSASYQAAASVTIGAQAVAPYNPLVKVDFYTNGVRLGTLTNSQFAPLYAMTATGLGAGAYVLTAVATDGSGLAGTSAPVNITITSASGLPYGLTTNAPVQTFLNMPTTFNGSLPPLLSGTGAYADTASRTPAGGLIPYAPNTPLWSDAAVKSRYMALPVNDGPLTPDHQISFLPTNSWTFPAGTVFVKNFDLVVNETNSSVPLRRLETRLLVRDINGAVYGVTYKWRADNSDADLLASSLNEDIVITNAAGLRTQTWYYPSPADCLSCHTPVANYVLGLNTRQLNGNCTYLATGNTDNQLRTFNRLGLFYPAINEAGISNYAKLSSLTNLSASLEERARSYLDANCAHCHQPGGQGITFDSRYDTPPVSQHITNFPAAFTLGFDRACVVKAKDVWRSVLLYRVQTNDATIKMPPLARNLVDTNAVQVITDWINSLPGQPALAPPTISPNGGAFSQSISVTLQHPDTNVVLFYTTDGTVPTTNSFLYSGPFLLTNSTSLATIASEAAFDNSIVSGASFTIQLAPQLTSLGFLSNGQFQLGVSGTAGKTYFLQASTNFTDWTFVSTNLAPSNLFNLLDPGASNFPYRFYRAVQQ